MDFKELANPDLFKPQSSLPSYSSNIGKLNYGNVSNPIGDNIQHASNLKILYGGKKRETLFSKNNLLNILLFIVLILLIFIFLGYKYYKKQNKLKKFEKMNNSINKKNFEKKPKKIEKKPKKIKKILVKNKNKRNLSNNFLL
jgi:amino acid permease